jgi:hypothetical protein
MRRPWTKADDAILRKLAPRDVAKQTGHSLPSVYSRRHDLGLPDRREVRWFKWTKAADQVVRTKSPKAAREALGLGRAAITRRRRFLKLPPWKPPVKPKPPPKRQTTPWTADEDQIVRKFPPREAAKLLPRRTLPAVYWRRFALARS